jgi:hypothetical protein
MPQADDDYRKRLAQKKVSLNKQNRETAFAKSKQMPSIVKPNKGLISIGPLDRFAERKAQGQNRLNLASMGQTGLRPFNLDPALEEAAVGAIGPVGAAGAAGSLLSRLSTPVFQRALQTARTEGKQVGADILEEGAMQGVKYGQSAVTRASEGAEQGLFDFISELQRLGVKPQTANRLLAGFDEYVNNPANAMITLGENMARNPASGKSAKKALLERMFREIGKSAEENFLG